jgi:hypothetical protein
MSSLEWYNEEKTIIRWTLLADATIDEFIESFKDFNKMLDGVDQVVFTIVEFPRRGKVDPKILSRYPEMAHLLPYDSNPHGQVGIVNNNRFFDTLLQIFGKVYFSRFVFFTSFEEAVADFEEKLACLVTD